MSDILDKYKNIETQPEKEIEQDEPEQNGKLVNGKFRPLRDFHVSEAEELEQDKRIVRTKIIDDKLIIDRARKKLIIEYRVGNLNEEGEFVDSEERTVVYRDEEFDRKVKEIFANDKLIWSKLRLEAKENYRGGRN